MNGHRSDAFLPVPPTPWAGTRGRHTANECNPMHDAGCSCDPMRARRAVPPEAPDSPTPLHHSRPTPSGPLLFLPLRERGGTEGTDRKKGSGGIESPDSASPLGRAHSRNGEVRPGSAWVRSRPYRPIGPRASEVRFTPIRPYRSSTRARAYRTFDIGREGANVGCSIHSLRPAPRLQGPLSRFLPDLGGLARWRWLEGLTRPFSALPFGCDNARMFGSKCQTGRDAPSVGLGRSVRVMRGWSEKSEILGPRYPSARLSALVSCVSSVFVWSTCP